MTIKPAYYNEIDKVAAQWLRNLIQAGHIAPGDVDERSILDVSPDDLRGYRQCHFFAGIGVWSYALRRAGWPDDREIWTGSCPCQPFSVAGVGSGFDDERHLWPFFHHLIAQRRPAAVTGEQVASKNADVWLDLVHTDLEALGYAFGAVAFPSAGIGAPHIRDRTYWVANAADQRFNGRRAGGARDGRDAARVEPERFCDAGGLGIAAGIGLERFRPQPEHREPGQAGQSQPSGLADHQLQQRQGSPTSGDVSGGWQQESAALTGLRCDMRPGPTNGLWRDADWLGCRDGKWRPVEPGTFPLAHGATNRVGRLRAYGNAINAEAAVAFLEAVIPSLS